MEGQIDTQVNRSRPNGSSVTSVTHHQRLCFVGRFSCAESRAGSRWAVGPDWSAVNLDEYQRGALRTAAPRNKRNELFHLVLGLGLPAAATRSTPQLAATVSASRPVTG